MLCMFLMGLQTSHRMVTILFLSFYLFNLGGTATSCRIRHLDSHATATFCCFCDSLPLSVMSSRLFSPSEYLGFGKSSVLLCLGLLSLFLLIMLRPYPCGSVVYFSLRLLPGVRSCFFSDRFSGRVDLVG